MGHSIGVAHAPSVADYRDTSPRFAQGGIRCGGEAERLYFQETPVRSVAGVGEFSHMPASSFFQTPILASW